MANYFQQEIECAPYEEIRKMQEEKLRQQVRHVYDNVPYYRQKMAEKGVAILMQRLNGHEEQKGLQIVNGEILFRTSVRRLNR